MVEMEGGGGAAGADRDRGRWRWRDPTVRGLRIEAGVLKLKRRRGVRSGEARRGELGVEMEEEMVEMEGVEEAARADRVNGSRGNVHVNSAAH